MNLHVDGGLQRGHSWQTSQFLQTVRTGSHHMSTGLPFCCSAKVIPQAPCSHLFQCLLSSPRIYRRRHVKYQSRGLSGEGNSRGERSTASCRGVYVTGNVLVSLMNRKTRGLSTTLGGKLQERPDNARCAQCLLQSED